MNNSKEKPDLSHINTLIFDLDGTLVDTAPDLLAATNHVLKKHGRSEVTRAQLLETISYGAREMIKQGFSLTGEPHGDDLADALFREFIDFYVNNLSVNSKPFPGCLSFLETAKAKGFKLAVCTNKLEAMARQLLSELKMDHLFEGIVGQDTAGVPKPDPAPFHAAVRSCRTSTATAVMVGDSKTDVRTAKAASVPALVCSFGYTDTPVKDLAADLVFHHYDELATIFIS